MFMTSQVVNMGYGFFMDFLWNGYGFCFKSTRTHWLWCKSEFGLIAITPM